MTYRLAILEDIPSIAKVHLMCFPDSMWAFLGEKLIRNFYSEYIKEQNIFVVATNEEGMVGFCMGYERPSQARNYFMAKNRGKLICRILVGLLTGKKIVYKKCIHAICNRNNTPSITEKGDLLSICVLPEYRGKGIAQELVLQFEHILQERNVPDYTLGVYTDNKRAISFYRQQGLTVLYEGKEELTMTKHL